MAVEAVVSAYDILSKEFDRCSSLLKLDELDQPHPKHLLRIAALKSLYSRGQANSVTN
jgi:hypothetical protein